MADAVVHIAGPEEIEYVDGAQRRAQRCLRCDLHLYEAPADSTSKFYDVGVRIAIDDNSRYTFKDDRDLKASERLCTIHDGETV